MKMHKIKESDLVLLDDLLNVIEDKSDEEIKAIKRITEVISWEMKKCRKQSLKISRNSL